MGKISYFDIVFPEECNVYHPGDIVNGHVRLELLEGIRVKGKCIKQQTYFLMIFYTVYTWMNIIVHKTGHKIGGQFLVTIMSQIIPSFISLGSPKKRKILLETVKSKN